MFFISFPDLDSTMNRERGAAVSNILAILCQEIEARVLIYEMDFLLLPSPVAEEMN